MVGHISRSLVCKRGSSDTSCREKSNHIAAVVQVKSRVSLTLSNAVRKEGTAVSMVRMTSLKHEWTAASDVTTQCRRKPAFLCRSVDLVLTDGLFSCIINMMCDVAVKKRHLTSAFFCGKQVFERTIRH